MSAATAVLPPVPDTVPVPLYTRHMVGAIEAARDLRRENRHHYTHLPAAIPATTT